MNALLPWQRERILRRLREGASLRRIEREAGLATGKTTRARAGDLTVCGSRAAHIRS